MASFSKSTSGYGIQCTSFRSISQCTALKNEKELNKFTAWNTSSPTTAKAICEDLSRLGDLYQYTDDLLNSPPTQQTFHLYQHEKGVDQLLDGSLRLLDICGSTRDVISQIKEHVRDIRSILRRRKGDLSAESSIAELTSFIEKMKKDAKRLIAALKEAENSIWGASLFDLDHQLTPVIEVSAMNISILQSLLLFLSLAVSKLKPTRRSLVSKLIHKKTVTTDDQLENMKELGSLDVALRTLCRCYTSKGENMQTAEKSLGALETLVEGIEIGLEIIFRHLIKTRATLLNAISP